MTRLRGLFVLVLLGPSLVAAPAAAQHPQVRQGFWFNGGLGYGSLGCDDCESRADGLSGGLSLGGTLSRTVLFGVGTAGWTREEFGARLTVATLDARFRFYTSSTGGFFFTTGLGLGTIHASGGGFSETETGLGLLLGLGYDIRVGANASLTPFWNGYAVRSGDADANVGQIGLGVTLH